MSRSTTIAPELLGLAGPFGKIARVMSGNWNVEIIPSGMKCQTDGKRIWIPFTADHLPEDKRQKLHGHLDHELSHVMEERAHEEVGRETPISALKRIRSPNTRMARIVSMLTNAYEDIRIERKYGARYPGMGENLAAKNVELIQAFRARTAKEKSRTSFWMELGCAIICRADGLDVGWVRSDVQPYVDLVADEIADVAKALWVQDCEALARRTFDKVSEAAKAAKEEAEKPAPPPEPEAAPESEEPPASPESDDGRDEGEPEPSEDGEPEASGEEMETPDGDAVQADGEGEEPAEEAVEASEGSDGGDDSDGESVSEETAEPEGDADAETGDESAEGAPEASEEPAEGSDEAADEDTEGADGDADADDGSEATSDDADGPGDGEEGEAVQGEQDGDSDEQPAEGEPEPGEDSEPAEGEEAGEPSEMSEEPEAIEGEDQPADGEESTEGEPAEAEPEPSEDGEPEGDGDSEEAAADDVRDPEMGDAMEADGEGTEGGAEMSAGEPGEGEEGASDPEASEGEPDGPDGDVDMPMEPGEASEAPGTGDDALDIPRLELAPEAEHALGDDVTTDDLFDIAKEEMERTIQEDVDRHHRYVPNPEAQKLDRFEQASSPYCADKNKALDNYSKAYDDVSSQIGALRGKQQSQLQTMTRRRVLPGLDAGRLDDDALANVRMGDRNVFTDISKKMAIDTAIEVLIDLSGSMGPSDPIGDPRVNSQCCAYYAKRTAIALAEAWEAIRVPYEIIGFYNHESRPHPTGGDWERAPEGYVSRAPLVFPIFKGWNERLSQCRDRFVAIHGYEQNADGEAVMAAARRVAGRREARRILVVISDGQPCHPGISRSTLERHLIQTVSTITSAGIEVWGIGAGTEAPRSYYNERTGAKNIIIRDLNKLAPTLFAALGQRLVVRAA